jgi:23S rRNA (uridine2552-2'-O)-methyltransferase
LGSKLGDRNIRHDKFYHKAKDHKYASRAYFKLEEIDKKFKFIKHNQKVLDLGAAPGSWIQYTQGKVGKKGSVVAIDLLPLSIKAAACVSFIQADIFDTSPEDFTNLSGGLFDVVLSDMAPNTTGVAFADASRSAALIMKIMEILPLIIKSDGKFVAKIFQGEDFDKTHKAIKSQFKRVKVFKPESSRPESKEIYFVAWQRREVFLP